MTEEQFTMAGRLLAISETVKSNILRECAVRCATEGVQAARGFIAGAWYVKGTAMHLEWKAACEILGMGGQGMTVVGQSFAMSGRKVEDAVRGARLLAQVQGVHVGQVLHSEILGSESGRGSDALLLWEVVLEECGDEDEVQESIHSAHMEGRETWSVPDCGECARAYEAQYR